ncbi:zinc-binding dehydrogenase [uncultured Tateyamaria sp.]
MEYLTPLWARGDLNPVIDRIFPLNDVSQAYAYMAKNSHLGKIVVKI